VEYDDEEYDDDDDDVLNLVFFFDVEMAILFYDSVIVIFKHFVLEMENNVYVENDVFFRLENVSDHRLLILRLFLFAMLDDVDVLVLI
jgi:hypothetical protein